jgi:hypothetical protein
VRILRRWLGVLFVTVLLGIMYSTLPASTLTRMRVPVSQIAVIAPNQASDEVSVLIQADLGALTANSHVLLAVLSLDVEAVNTLEDRSVVQLDLLPIVTEWESSTACWDYPWGTPGGDVISRFRERYLIREAGRARFDITRLVQSWSDGSLENHGILLRASSSYGGTFSVDLLSAQNGPAGLFVMFYQPDK